LVYALVGGVDTILGPLLGAAVLRALTDQLSRGSTQSSLYIGIVLMLVVYFIPDGLVGVWRRVPARLLPARRDAQVKQQTSEPVAAGMTAENVEAL
jgi:branched-chain amino acid transport system permease protein